VNNVSLIGSLVQAPQLTADDSGSDVCFMRIEVPRRARAGEREPGVLYVDVTTHGRQARICAEELAAGRRIGVSGTLEREDALGSRGPRRSRWQVHAHQVDILDSAPVSDA
jgi:single-stranded DNA-binding protein